MYFFIIAQVFCVFVLSKFAFALGYLFMDDLSRAISQFYPSASGGMSGGSSTPPGPSGHFGILLPFGSTDEVTQDDLFDALEAQEAPAPPEVAHPDPPQEERAELFLEVKTLIVQQLQEASRKAHEVRLSVYFPEMQEADFDTAEWIMDWDLELSRETTDAATLREWRDSIRENPRLLRDIISEYVIVVTNPKKYDLSEIYGLCRKDTKLD